MPQTKILSVSSIAAPYFVGAALADKVTLAARWRNHLVVLSENAGSLTRLGTIQVGEIQRLLHISAAPLEKG